MNLKCVPDSASLDSLASFPPTDNNAPLRMKPFPVDLGKMSSRPLYSNISREKGRLSVQNITRELGAGCWQTTEDSAGSSSRQTSTWVITNAHFIVGTIYICYIKFWCIDSKFYFQLILFFNSNYARLPRSFSVTIFQIDYRKRCSGNFGVIFSDKLFTFRF